MKLDHALALAARGFKVFPIAVNAKSPPLLNGWPQKATSNPDDVKLMWLAVPNANVGIHCEGLVVIDVDVAKGGSDAIEFLRMSEDLPATLCTNTPTGGSHLFYRLPDGHPGAANSVGRLGVGLDIRSTGGYVVAPGSVVPAGAYAFADPAAQIAPAPDWLVERLGRILGGVQGAHDAIRDAPVEVVKRAREWLAEQAPAVQGQGGDARTFAVACGLRDMGVSRTQALELLTLWNENCLPPWEAHDLGVKAANAYRYAENDAGARAALPDDFPIVLNAGTTEPKTGFPSNSQIGGKALSLAEFAGQDEKTAGYAIKGMLQRASYAEVFGAPGEGKTFIALDMAYHVAAALPWHGRKVHTGPVLYLAYEGQGGLRKRAKALRQKYGTKDVPLYIAGAAFNLREAVGRRELGALMATLPAKPVLIVIDTFARALMGGDENSAQDVGAFNTAIAALIENTGACVCIVHHSGKDKSKGARGSSALLGAIDTEIEIDGGQVIARKQRDVEIAPAIGFKLVPLIVGIDEDGDDQTSCVVEPVALGGPGSLERISGNARRGFDALCAMQPDNSPVDPLAWRDRCVEFLGGKSTAQRFYDLKKVLLSKGYVEVNERGWIVRRMT